MRTEANDNYPNIWSWQTGWDQGSRFSDEDDMLETQTFFHISGNQNGQQGDWKIGQFDIYMERGKYEVQTDHFGIFHGVNFPQNGQIKINPFWSVVFHYTCVRTGHMSSPWFIMARPMRNKGETYVHLQRRNLP